MLLLQTSQKTNHLLGSQAFFLSSHFSKQLAREDIQFQNEPRSQPIKTKNLITSNRVVAGTAFDKNKGFFQLKVNHIRHIHAQELRMPQENFFCTPQMKLFFICTPQLRVCPGGNFASPCSKILGSPLGENFFTLRRMVFPPLLGQKFNFTPPSGKKIFSPREILHLLVHV